MHNLLKRYALVLFATYNHSAHSLKDESKLQIRWWQVKLCDNSKAEPKKSDKSSQLFLQQLRQAKQQSDFVIAPIKSLIGVIKIWF